MQQAIRDLVVIVAPAVLVTYLTILMAPDEEAATEDPILSLNTRHTPLVDVNLDLSGAPSFATSVLSWKKSAPAQHFSYSNDIAVVCLRPTEMALLANTYRFAGGTRLEGTEVRPGGRYAGQVLWGDKGVWSTKMNFTPNNKYNLFTPFTYKNNEYYVWGVTVHEKSNSVLVAGTAISCHLPTSDKAGVDLVTASQSKFSVQQSLEMLLKSSLLTYTSLRDAPLSSTSTKALPAPKEFKDITSGTARVKGEEASEAAYRATHYVKATLKAYDTYNIKPDTLHFASVRKLNVDSLTYLEDFKGLDSLNGSPVAYAISHQTVLAKTMDRLDGNFSEVYSDFESLPLRAPTVNLVKVPTSPKGSEDPLKKLPPSNEELAALKLSNEKLAFKVKEMEAIISSMAQKNTPAMDVPKVKVPVQNTPAPNPTVSATEVAKHISAN